MIEFTPFTVINFNNQTFNTYKDKLLLNNNYDNEMEKEEETE